MVPFQPPLPIAWKSLFQPDAGSQTSILMSESDDGASVAMTRQNSGTLLKGAGLPKGPPGGPAGPAGGVKAPAATLCAELMVTLGRLTLERVSQVEPPVGAPIKEAAGSRSAAMENFVMDILPGNYIPG